MSRNFGWIVDMHFTGKDNGWLLATKPQYPYDYLDQIFVNIKNGGNEIQFYEIDQTIRFFDICFVAGDKGFAFGKNKITEELNVYKLTRNANVLTIEDPGGFFQVAPWAKISFINENEGWIASGVIWHTKDGGKSWEKQYDYSGIGLYSIQFIDSQHGWVAGGGAITRTTDGRENWETIYLPDTSSIEAFHFTDKDYGWSVGEGAYKTTNGGKTWIGMDWNKYESLTDVMFVNRNIGYILRSPIIYKTTDGGENWNITNQMMDSHLYKIFFTEEFHGWAYGTGGILLKYSEYTDEDTNGTNNAGIDTLPRNFNLFQNYPNPFNNFTTLKFNIPEEGKAIIKIYNILGEEVAILRNCLFSRGMHKIKWDGKDDLNRAVASGVYFMTLEYGGISRVRKIAVIK